MILLNPFLGKQKWDEFLGHIRIVGFGKQSESDIS